MVSTAARYTDPGWHARAAGRWLPIEWPLILICAGMPFAFLLGVHGLVWILPVFVFGFQLLVRREPLVIPRSGIPLLLLVLWIPIPMLQLAPAAALLPVYRYLVFASPLICYLWLVNTRESDLATTRVVRLLSTLWIVVIVFGFLAFLFPDVNATSPIQQVLPGSLLSNSYFRDITSWRFAEVQDLVSIEVGRPAAPMAYSNGWGSTVGLLTPFFVLDYFILANPRRRRYGILIALLGGIPIIMSLNRGLWLSVGVAFAYVAIRRAMQGSVRVILATGLGVLLVVGALAATTLGDAVEQRFEVASASNETRGELYTVAIDATGQSPLLGYGAPIDRGLWREVGTHGLVWFVMVSYGYPGLILLLAWAVAIFLASASAVNPIALWAHVAIVVFIVQMPIYGLLPQLMLVGVAAAVAWRAHNLGAMTS